MTKSDIINQLHKKRELIRELMNSHVMKRVPFYFTRLFRARPVPRGRLFSTVKQLWYPPPGKLRSFGRANGAGESRFYAAENPHTALKETTLDGHVSVCLEVELKDPKTGPFHFAVGADELLKDRGWDTQPANDPDVEAFLIAEFRRQDSELGYSPYELSSLIAEEFFKLPRLDGLLYPSVPFGFAWLNVALRPESVDKLYAPKDAQVYVGWMGLWARIGVGYISSDGKISYRCEEKAINNLPSASETTKTRLMALFDP